MKNKKIIILLIMLTLASFMLAGCSTEITSTKKDIEETMNVANNLTENQPTPTDIDYSLERYNLIRRSYWVNGQREKANTLVCEIEKPLRIYSTIFRKRRLRREICGRWQSVKLK